MLAVLREARTREEATEQIRAALSVLHLSFLGPLVIIDNAVGYRAATVRIDPGEGHPQYDLEVDWHVPSEPDA